MPGILHGKEARPPGDQFHPVRRATQGAAGILQVKRFWERFFPYQVLDESLFLRNLQGLGIAGGKPSRLPARRPWMGKKKPRVI